MWFCNLEMLSFKITLCYTQEMKSEAEKLGKNLKRIRTEKGITQGDIAKSLSVSRGFVSNIENGKTNPTLSTISRLANAIGVTTDELLK
jgi:transcriptional regulator with XRE-family HTH domain